MWYSFSRNSVLFAPDKNLKIIHRTVVCFTRVKHLHITWVIMPFSGSVHGHTAFHTVHLVRLSGCKIQEINHGLIAPFPSTGRWQIAQSDNQITSVISCSSVWKIWKKLEKFLQKISNKKWKRLLYGDIYCLFNFKPLLFLSVIGFFRNCYHVIWTVTWETQSQTQDLEFALQTDSPRADLAIKVIKTYKDMSVKKLHSFVVVYSFMSYNQWICTWSWKKTQRSLWKVIWTNKCKEQKLTVALQPWWNRFRLDWAH